MAHRRGVADQPWPEPVNGAALVAELTAAIRKYVGSTTNEALAAAPWVLHTYCFDVFGCTPRLAITAPEKRCGKTTLFDVVKPLVPRALLTANVTAAATFRPIETLRPVLLIDEGDTFFGENEELRGILNSGHRQGGQVGGGFAPAKRRSLMNWRKMPRALLPTIARQSAHASLLSPMRFSTARLIIGNRRLQSLAMSPKRARAVALAACGIEDELSRSAMQLADIREVFEECASGRMTSPGLTADLVAMADKPWCECNHGKPLTQNGFARRLTPFEIVTVMIGPKNNPLGFAQPAAVEINARFNAAICCPRERLQDEPISQDIGREIDFRLRGFSAGAQWIVGAGSA